MEKLSNYNVESLEQLLQESVTAKNAIRILNKNMEAWKKLVTSLQVQATTSSRKVEDVNKDELLHVVIKVLGKICNGESTVLDEDEMTTLGKKGNQEISPIALSNILQSICNQALFNLLCQKFVTWMVIQPVKVINSKTEKQKSLPLNTNELLSCLLNICRTLMEVMPYTSKEVIDSTVTAIIGILKGTSDDNESGLIVEEFEKIKNDILAINLQLYKEDEKKPKYGFSEEQEQRMHDREPPNDFRKVSIVPTITELTGDKFPFLRPNKVKGNYFDAEHYLDVQFRLLREDFVQPLRKGIEDFLEFSEEYIRTNGRKRKSSSQQNSSVRRYIGVRFREKEMVGKDKATNAVNYLFNLPAGIVSKINWEKSKRLLPGCLVMLTSDLCRTAIFATVLASPRNFHEKDKEKKQGDSRRRELMNGILRVSVEAGEELIDSSLPYVMLECEAFFEAYRYNLNILQKMNLSEFPLQKFIVFPEDSVAETPSYYCTGGVAGDTATEQNDEGPERRIHKSIKLPYYFTTTKPPEPIRNARDRYRNILAVPAITVQTPKRVPITDPNSWPSDEIKQKLGLDENQYSAYRAALTSEFAIIQGPPGTGKTFIGLKIVETLLLNKRRNRLGPKEDAYIPPAPILIVCYTNHALDQFLELINKGNNYNMVRVGGQSKTESLTSCTLQEVRKKFQMKYRNSGYNRNARGCRPAADLILEQLRYQQQMEHEAYCRIRDLEDRLENLDNGIKAVTNKLGLPNISELTCIDYRIQDYVNQTIPARLLKLLLYTSKCQRWLGLTDEIFEQSYFSAGRILNQWIRLRPVNNQQTKTLLLRTEEKTATCYYKNNMESCSQNMDTPHEAAVNFLDESNNLEDGVEDYDLDELLEQRIEDIRYETFYDDTTTEYKEKRGKVIPLAKFYMRYECDTFVKELGASVSALDLKIGINEKHISKHCPRIQANKKRRQSKKCPDCEKRQTLVNQLTKQKLICENKLKLIVAILDSHERQLLDLPDVTKYFQTTIKKKNSESDNADEASDDDSDDSDLFSDDGLREAEDIDINDETNYDQLNMDERWSLYFNVINLLKGYLPTLVPIMRQELKDLTRKYDIERQMVDGLILKQSDIIGMTTTGASKYHDLLEIAKPEIVIIEEAAEILESHTVTSLTKHCKHLILIGDHLQLRPSTNVFQLSRKFHMDLSLFERMINNEMNLFSLKTQHRMRPEIADLIVGPIYEELHNYENVFKYPDVKGVCKNLYLLSHEEYEQSDNEILSKSNQHEANFLTSFCYYLIQQGYDPSQITILTTYTGQMFVLKKKLSRDCGRVRITCVDNYQGEENDIILLSLVRSNVENKVGFVGVDNRICVALSRARHGLFIMGNVKSLTARSDTWKRILEKLTEKQNCGESFSLICQRHGNITEVSKGEDFEPLKDGGCSFPCNKILMCGHICRLECHSLDLDHEKYECFKRCDKLCQAKAHECPARCYEKCPPCKVEVIRQLPSCKHDTRMFCHNDPAKITCMVIETRTLPCGDEEPLPCHIDFMKYLCRRKVRKGLNCGHKKEMQCFEDAEKAQCNEQVEKEMVPCRHKQYAPCFQPADKINCTTVVDFIFSHCKHEQKLLCWKTRKATCPENCSFTLNCGHKCNLKCHVTDDPNHLRYQCQKKCRRLCQAEGHECSASHRCFEQPCPPCTEIVEKVLPCSPEHTAYLPCGGDPCTYQCSKDVIRLLPCGHPIKGKCWDRNILNTVCTFKMHKLLEECGHTIENICGDVVHQTSCMELTLMKCDSCNCEQYVICCFADILFCSNQKCRRKYPHAPVPYKRPVVQIGFTPNKLSKIENE